MKTRDSRITNVSKAITQQQPPVNSISVSWRNDGLVEWDLPGGGIELITEAEYKARGGILVKWVDEVRSK